MNTNVTNTYTDIYINGGGNWLTESYATNFHHFYNRKMMTGSESMADFREITDAEKTALEASDAVWVRPPQDLIDWWNYAFGKFGQYNESTGFFEAYDALFDITAEQAWIIRLCSDTKLHASGEKVCQAGSYNTYSLTAPRTLAPPRICTYEGSMNYAFEGMRTIEAIGWVGGYTTMVNSLSPWTNAFSGCSKLKLIATPFQRGRDTKRGPSAKTFAGCYDLESLKCYVGAGLTLDLHWSPKINLQSLQYSIDVTHTEGGTIVVHPDVYAKLTGDTTNAAAAALSEEELAEWTALIEQAVEKNIQFATV